MIADIVVLLLTNCATAGAVYFFHKQIEAGLGFFKKGR